MAKQLAEAQLEKKDRPKTRPPVIIKLNATKDRDTNGWHALDYGPPRTVGNKVIHPVQTTNRTKIDQVPSSQLVNYPT